MSGWSDDYDAECRMLREAHGKLAVADPKNKWLAHYDAANQTLHEQKAVAALWSEQHTRAYGSEEHDILRLLSAYTARLKVEQQCVAIRPA